MKLSCISDLHLEQRAVFDPPRPEFDVLVVAGDVSENIEEAIHVTAKLAGGKPAVAAVVQREGFEDFVDGIGFVAHGARAWREGAPARATAEERDALKFLFSRALFYKGAAVAMRAALGRFD